MILRIVRGTLPSHRLAEMVEGLIAGYGAVASRMPGLVRYHVAVRPSGATHEVVAVTFWTSVEAAAAAYGGDLAEPRTLVDLSVWVTFDRVAYFEVDESQLRRATGSAAVLRLTVGRIAQGIDAAIQQELRQRLRELPEIMTEAYVGRRIRGTDVEVAFLSTWERVPPDRSLDEPIWPEISARYDEFVLETFVPVVSGPSAG